MRRPDEGLILQPVRVFARPRPKADIGRRSPFDPQRTVFAAIVLAWHGPGRWHYVRSREAPDLNFNDEHYLIRASRRKLRD